MRQHGLTLVELLITIAISAILLGIGVPGYANLVNQGRLAGVTNSLVSSLMLARSEAIKRGTRVTVCKTSGPLAALPSCDDAASWQQGWLIFVDGGTRGVIDTGDTLLRTQDGASTVVTITANNYSRYISYLPSGGSQGSNGLANGTIQICAAGNRRDIVINITGRPRLGSGIC